MDISVVAFFVHEVLNEEVYVLHFSKGEPLEHSETLSRVEHFEGSQSAQHLHRLVAAIVYPVVWIFIKDVQH